MAHCHLLLVLGINCRPFQGTSIYLLISCKRGLVIHLKATKNPPSDSKARATHCAPVSCPAATDSSFPGQLHAGSPERDKALGRHPASSPLPPERCLPGVTCILKSKCLPAPIKLVVCRQIGSRPERKQAGERAVWSLQQPASCLLALWLLQQLGFSLHSLWCLSWAEVLGGHSDGISIVTLC